MFDKLYIFDILIHVTFLYIILYLFFYLVGIKKEGDVLRSYIKDMAEWSVENNQNLKNLRRQYQMLPKLEQKQWKDNVTEILETQTSLNNTDDRIYKNIGVVLLVLFILSSIYYGYYLIVKKNIPYGKITSILFNNLILFAAICSIEMLFFFLVIMKFVPIKKSEINRIFIQEFNK